MIEGRCGEGAEAFVVLLPVEVGEFDHADGETSMSGAIARRTLCLGLWLPFFQNLGHRRPTDGDPFKLKAIP